MFPSYLELEKKLVPSYFGLENTVAAILREKKVDPCYLENKKCSSQLLGERKKIITSISSQNTGSQQLTARKKCFPVICKWKILVPSYFKPEKLSHLFGERKSGSLLFGD